MDYNVEYYQTGNGQVPMIEFLPSLQPKMRAKAYSEIALPKKHGLALREPSVKPIKGTHNQGLYELRIKFSGHL